MVITLLRYILHHNRAIMDNKNTGLFNLGTISELVKSLKDATDAINSFVEEAERRIEKPVSEDQVCQELGIPPRTIKHYRKNNLLRSYKLGGKTFLYWSEINEDIKRNADVF